MKEFGFYPSSKVKPRTDFKWRNHMMRFACSEHLRSPQSDCQFHLPCDYTLLEGPRQPKLSPRNSSAYAYWDQRDSFIISWHLWTRRFCLQAFIFQSILVFIPRHISILAMCPYVLATCHQGSSCLGTPMLVRHGILCRKPEMMGKVKSFCSMYYNLSSAGCLSDIGLAAQYFISYFSLLLAEQNMWTKHHV